MHKYGLRAIGLALMAALGLMAFASVAQAAELTLHAKHTAILRGNGTFVPIGTSLPATGVQVGKGKLLVPGKKTEIECEAGNVTEGSVENREDTAEEIGKTSEKNPSGLKLHAMGRVTFEKCIVLVGGAKSEPCTKAFNEHNKNLAGEPGKPTTTGLILTILHEHVSTIAGEVLTSHLLVLRIKPLLGVTKFIELEFGGTCSLPAKVPVSGSVAGEIEMPEGKEEKDKTSFTVNFESSQPLGVIINKLPLIESKLFFGESEAFLDGKVKVSLVSGEAFGLM